MQGAAAGVAQEGGSEEGITPQMFFANITKAYLGGGVVLLPEAICCGGFLFGPAAILVLALLLNHTMKLLVRMAVAVHEQQMLEHMLLPHAAGEQEEPLLLEHRAQAASTHHEPPPGQLGHDAETAADLRRSRPGRDGGARDLAEGNIGLGSIGEFCFGRGGRVMTHLALLSTNVGIVTSYMNLNAQSFQQVLFGETARNDHYQAVLWGQFASLCVLCMLDPQQLSFASLLGNLAVTLTMGVAVANSLLFMYSPERPPDAQDSAIFAAIHAKYVAAVPTIFFSFVMHGTILSQYRSMQPSRRSEAPRQLNLAALFVSVAYALFASVVYVAYYSDLSAEGYKAGTSILLILRPQTSLVRATTTLLSFAIFLSIPLFMHAIFDTLGLAWRGTPDGASCAAPARARAAVIGVLRVLVLLLMAGALSVVRYAAPRGEGAADPLQARILKSALDGAFVSYMY